MIRMFSLAMFMVVVLAGCGGGGIDPTPTTGTISGTVIVGGPLDSSATLHVGLFSAGSNTPLRDSEIGHVTSAHATSAERSNPFSFTGVELGTYLVRAYGEKSDGSTAFYFTSDQLTITGTSPNISGLDCEMSFTGAGPWGTISGVIDLGGDWPADRTVFIGFTQASSGEIFDYPVTEHQASDGFVEHTAAGQVIFNISHLAYGTYTVGIYGYNSTTHAFTAYGERDAAVTVHGGDPNITNVNFPANFGGDPGTDPVLGTISGTVSFNGALPATGGFIAIGANTIPPQQGAPIASFDIEPGDLDTANQVAYSLTDLPDGEYTIGIFSYDFATHTAVYFGAYDGTVTVTDGANDITGIDFTADVTLL